MHYRMGAGAMHYRRQAPRRSTTRSIRRCNALDLLNVSGLPRGVNAHVDHREPQIPEWLHPELLAKGSSDRNGAWATVSGAFLVRHNQLTIAAPPTPLLACLGPQRDTPRSQGNNASLPYRASRLVNVRENALSKPSWKNSDAPLSKSSFTLRASNGSATVEHTLVVLWSSSCLRLQRICKWPDRSPGG